MDVMRNLYMRTILHLLYILPALLLPLPLEATVTADSCPVQKLHVERLPQLNVARTGHFTFCTADGEVVVMGGHTAGFVPTAIAEFLRNGQWQQQPMIYTHDNALAVQTSQGSIIISGGHEQPLGIGQTFTFECYDPTTGIFDGYGCLEQKRCFAQALEMDSSQIVISGNWYANDCIELFDGSRQCHLVKEVTQQRSCPYLLRTAKDNAIIFGSNDYHAEPHDTIIIDRLQGEPFVEPLLQQWRPFYFTIGYRCANGFIGDEQQQYYAYLIPATNQQGQMALIKVEGEQFTLLPTTSLVPTESQWGPINYFTGVIANRQARQAYLVGYGSSDADRRLYVLSIDYDQDPAVLTLLQSEPQDSIGCYCPVLTPEGNLLMAGGVTMPGNNFTPQSTALLMYTGTQTPPSSNDSQTMVWPWILLAALVAGGGCLALMLHQKKKPKATKSDELLMQRICQLMEEEQLYLNSELKLSDVAKRLQSNNAYISSCINTLKGCSFSVFVNNYRIEHAKRLLREQPEAKVYEVCVASGFSTETSFFRAFKAHTGKTPTEWRQQNDSQDPTRII